MEIKSDQYKLTVLDDNPPSCFCFRVREREYFSTKLLLTDPAMPDICHHHSRIASFTRGLILRAGLLVYRIRFMMS